LLPATVSFERTPPLNDARRAVIATLIENCKLSGINPHTWLTQTLEKLVNGHPANSVGELMPWIAVA